MKNLLPTLLFILNITFFSCNPSEPVDDRQLTLTVEDVSSIEAWLNIKTSNIPLPTNVSITANTTLKKQLILTTNDTLIFVDSLQPSTSYSFQAVAGEISSAFLTAVTMDTTSHNYTWQTFEFGEHSSSVLYDVAIIDENNIWAVGEIYLNDSLGVPDPTRYNLVIWDGSNWSIRRVPYHFQGQPFYHPIQSVFVLDLNDIWFCGNGVMHWDGFQYNEIPIPTSVWGPSQINKIWGTSSNNLYIVGNDGNIAHYNGNGWQKIESGTNVDIQDIWGVENDFSSERLILCAASYVAQTGVKKILSITNVTQIDTIFWGTGRRVHSLWFNSGNKLFTSGGGVFIRNYNDHWVEQTEIPLYFTERVRGNEKNDVFVVGHFGLIAHYNGSSWRTYPEASNALVYTSLDCINNLMVTVGYTQRKGVIQLMRKE